MMDMSVFAMIAGVGTLLGFIPSYYFAQKRAFECCVAWITISGAVMLIATAVVMARMSQCDLGLRCPSNFDYGMEAYFIGMFIASVVGTALGLMLRRKSKPYVIRAV